MSNLNPLPDRVDPAVIDQLGRHLGVPIDQLDRIEFTLGYDRVHLLVKTNVGAAFKGARRLDWPDCLDCGHNLLDHEAGVGCLGDVPGGDPDSDELECRCDGYRGVPA